PGTVRPASTKPCIKRCATSNHAPPPIPLFSPQQGRQTPSLLPYSDLSPRFIITIQLPFLTAAGLPPYTVHCTRISHTVKPCDGYRKEARGGIFYAKFNR